jgi:UDP-N-acetyl-D-glucosamine dehydrogenase
VIKLLIGLGAQVSYSDPFVSSLSIEGQLMKAVLPGREVLSSTDLAIVITNHTAFNYADIVKNAPIVFDTRNATDGLTAKNIVRL